MKHKIEIGETSEDFINGTYSIRVDGVVAEEAETVFDRDKFANDFEEEHGWCPDAGYDIIQYDTKKEQK